MIKAFDAGRIEVYIYLKKLQRLRGIFMKIQSVAVLGAGAVGSYVIWGLSEKKNISLSVIAKGERAERLKADGCLINGKTYHPEVLTPEEAKGVDLLVVSL